jgi:hypothetical protein
VFWKRLIINDLQNDSPQTPVFRKADEIARFKDDNQHLCGKTEKSRGDRGSAPYGKSLRAHTFGTLIPTVVASNSLNLAIADTLVSANPDKFHDLHSSGEVHDNTLLCSFFHEWIFNLWL